MELDDASSQSLPHRFFRTASPIYNQAAAPTTMFALRLTLLVTALPLLSGSEAVRIHPNGNASLCLTCTGDFTVGLSNHSVDLQSCTVGNDRQIWNANSPFVTQFSQGGMCLRSRGGE